MGATDVLSEEHGAVERILAVLDVAAGRLEEGRPVRPGLFIESADFLANFVDRCHHQKEEGHLFPTLQAAGVPGDGGPIGVMLMEHVEGREYIAAMKEAAAAYARGDDSAAPDLAQAIRSYAELLRAHIWKENNILFPMAEEILSPEDHAALTQRFEQLEEEVVGPGVHEQYHQMLDNLATEMGVE